MVVQIMPKFITDENMYEVGFLKEICLLFSSFLFWFVCLVLVVFWGAFFLFFIALFKFLILLQKMQ